MKFISSISARTRGASFGMRAALVLLAAGICAADPSAKPAAARAPVAAGDDALARFDLAAALAQYRKAVEQAPDDYEAAWKLARALLDQGTLTPKRKDQKPLFEEAERLARRAVELNPADSMGHTFLAVAVGQLALFEGGKRKVELSKEIKTHAEKAIALNAEDNIAHHVLGIWHREMAELNAVTKTLAEWVYGRFPPASLADSERLLRRAAELAPEVLAHPVELGRTLAAQGKKAEAKRVLEAALKMPKTWVTDEYYRDLAQAALKRLK